MRRRAPIEPEASTQKTSRLPSRPERTCSRRSCADSGGPAWSARGGAGAGRVGGGGGAPGGREGEIRVAGAAVDGLAGARAAAAAGRALALSSAREEGRAAG